MQIKSYRNLFQKELSSIYDEKEAESFFYLILEYFHKLKRIDLALNPDLELSESDLGNWNKVLSELKSQRPIQYILRETEFYGLRFLVNENVLIPRPETEELVEWIISENRIDNPKILDIGTGSGCIAISLAKNLKARVFALDVSEGALSVAQKNAGINKAKVTFIHQNILETDDLKQQFEVIVSNPPYVRMLEKEGIKPNVLEFEPHLALFVEDNDALLFYRKIAELAQINLTEKGKLYFEINQYLGKETVLLLENLGFQNVILKQDIYGNDRMISATYS